MKHKSSDIEVAFDYVSSQPRYTNSAILCRETGRIFYLSDFGDSDEDVPDDIDDGDKYLEIPHKNDLDLGTSLVRRFVNSHTPSLHDEVANIFSRKGAYARFKAMLANHGLLDAWYDFENVETANTLKTWAKDAGVELEE